VSAVWRLRALRFVAEIEVADPALDGYLRRLFRDLRTDDAGAIDVEWQVEAAEADGSAGWAFVTRGHDRYEFTDSGHVALEMLQTLNARCVATWPGVVCHAGCVSLDDRAVMLPAHPNAGKTTLTTGLVRAGFRYVTDEGVAFEDGTTRIRPYPKPLALDAGSWSLFPEFEPAADLPGDDYKRTQWHIPASDIRADAVSGACDARWIVFPTYEAGAATELVPMRRAAALVELAKNTFDFPRHGVSALEQLATVVRACDCYRLTVGNLADAVASIEDLVARG
jgi:hypothetical protein